MQWVNITTWHTVNNDKTLIAISKYNKHSSPASAAATAISSYYAASECSSCGQCELSGSEVGLSLLLLGSSQGEFVSGKLLSVCSGLLLSQIVGSVLLLFEAFTCGVSSLLVDHSQHLGDGLSGVLFWSLLSILIWTIVVHTFIRANLAWGAALTLLTLNYASSFY